MTVIDHEGALAAPTGFTGDGAVLLVEGRRDAEGAASRRRFDH
jgi:hypothetical protein